MDLATKCIGCNSERLDKQLGHFQPFISHKLGDLPVGHISINGANIGHPVIFTNSMKCSDCGLIFSQSRPNDAEMGRIYEDYRGPEYKAIREQFEPGYSSINDKIGVSDTEIEDRQRGMEQILLPHIDQDHKISRVLDYGGDRGQHIPQFLDIRKKYVWEVSNSEPLKGIQRIDDLESFGYADLIMCCHVLEHLSWPLKTLKTLKSLCHNSSFLYVEVPLELAPSTWPGAFHEHINFFNNESLKEIVETAGFKTLEIKSFKVRWALGTSTNIGGLFKLQ